MTVTKADSYAAGLRAGKKAADELRRDGQAAVWIRGVSEDHAVTAERIRGQVAAGYGEASQDDVAAALAELAEAHKAAAELLKWWAERSAQRHRGEPDDDGLAKRIVRLRGNLAGQSGRAEQMRDKGQLVPGILVNSIHEMAKDIAWLEELQRHRSRLTCVVCSCGLEPPEGPPHCEDCLPDPEGDYR
jgi:hypothetical protein